MDSAFFDAVRSSDEFSQKMSTRQGRLPPIG